jgi:LL-diaminopimelate aminotransferase
MYVSKIIQNLAPYAFAEVDKLVDNLKDQGITPIDFGVGDPVDPTPEFIRESLKSATDTYAASGYPSNAGMPRYRQAIAEWYKTRFKVELDPETEICSNIGSKEGIFNFPLGYIDPEDYVLVPSPGYPPYKQGTRFAQGKPYFYPLLEENDFFPDFEAIPKEIIEKAKILWLCYPNSPTGKLATKEFYQKAYEFCQANNIIMACDDCYSEIYFANNHPEPPISALSIGKKGVVVFNSLSKRSCMTGYRVGFVVGDPELITTYKKLKSNIDSGTATFVQEAAITALQDETHVQQACQNYQTKLEILSEALQSIGLTPAKPEGSFYMWQRVPENYDSVSFAKKLLDPAVGIVVTPGQWLSDECHYKNKKINPGQNYIRFALVPSIEECKQAAEKIKQLKI